MIYFFFVSVLLFLWQVKVQGQNEEMLLAACEQFLGKDSSQIRRVALETLEGHQRAIMGSMTVEVFAYFALHYLHNIFYWFISYLFFLKENIILDTKQ